MLTKSESHNKIGACIRINFACGGSAPEYISPIVILVSGLADTEMPHTNFIAVHVEVMTINGHMDPKDKELGCTCSMKHDVKQIHFLIGSIDTLLT